MRKSEGLIYLIGFIGSIWAANWLVTHWGTIQFGNGPWLISVWPGELTRSGNPVYAPSGVLAIGLGFTLRDLVQRRLGVQVTIVAIVMGALLSAALDSSLALASGIAFLLSETLDLFVYTPLQRRHLVGAVIASNTVGLVVDSIVFLTIAFGSLSLLQGQILGKVWMTLVAIPVIYALREWDRKRGLVQIDVDPVAST